MKYEFVSEVIEWRGPAPFFFATTPDEVTRHLEVSANHLRYGRGCIPVDVTIGNTTFYTSLMPREGTYFVPLKATVRKAGSIKLGSQLRISISPKS